MADFHYIMTPTAAADNLYQNAIGLNCHRVGMDHAGVVPVFLDARQRASFQMYAYKNKARGAVGSVERLVANWLDKGSRAVNPVFGTRVPVLEAADKQIIYIQGHGGAGDTSLTDNHGVPSTVLDIAIALAKIKISKRAILKCNTYSSGANVRAHFKTRADALFSFENNNLAQYVGTDLSLAHALKIQMHTHIGNIIGYLGVTTLDSLEVLTRLSGGNLGQGNHMAVQLTWGTHDGKIYVRKTQAEHVF